MDPLTTAEKFLFVSINPDKGNYRVAQSYVNMGVIGGALTDLAAKGELSIKDENLTLTGNWRGKEVTVQDKIIKNIAETRKNKPVQWWIRHLSLKGNKYRHTALDMLTSKNLIRVEKKRFLFIPYKVATIANSRVLRDLIADLRETVLNKDLKSANSGTLALMNTCKMHAILARSKSERKRIKTLLDEYARDTAITEGIDKVIREMEVAIMIATTASIATTTSASHH